MFGSGNARNVFPTSVNASLHEMGTYLSVSES